MLQQEKEEKTLQLERERAREDRIREQELDLEKIRRAERESEQAAQREHELKKLQMLQDNPQLASAIAPERPFQYEGNGHRQEAFRVDNAARLLSVLDSENIASYFIIFERIALIQKWKREYWTQILNVKLNSKCVKILAEMTEEQVGDYEAVKRTLLEQQQQHELE